MRALSHHMGKVLLVCNACFRQPCPDRIRRDGRSVSSPPRGSQRLDFGIASTGGPQVRDRPLAPGRAAGRALEARGRRAGMHLGREAAADLVVLDERRPGRGECALAGRTGVVPRHQGPGRLRIERHAQGGLGAAPILFVEGERGGTRPVSERSKRSFQVRPLRERRSNRSESTPRPIGRRGRRRARRASTKPNTGL